jgi:hypothetical protein
MKRKIYKVRCVVRKRIKRGKAKGQIEEVYRLDEKVIIDNLNRAREIYKDEEAKAEYYFQFADYFGSVELFIPHIQDNGELAYWPDKKNNFIVGMSKGE